MRIIHLNEDFDSFFQRQNPQLFFWILSTKYSIINKKYFHTKKFKIFPLIGFYIVTVKKNLILVQKNNRREIDVKSTKNRPFSY